MIRLATLALSAVLYAARRPRGADASPRFARCRAHHYRHRCRLEIPADVEVECRLVSAASHAY